MGIVQLSDYKVELAGKICLDRFENDIMLIFNNFSTKSVIQIIELIKNDIKVSEEMGIVFDVSFLRIFCTMYLGLAWSMYKKGRSIQKQENYINVILQLNDYTSNSEMPVEYILRDEYVDVAKAISLRYYDLYLNHHINDMMARMDIGLHPRIENVEQLRTFVLDILYRFGIRILLIGILDEYKESNS